MTGTYEGQKPYGGEGGSWVLEVIRAPAAAPRAATITPEVTCLLGVGQPSE